MNLPGLAAHLGVAQVLAKDESRRMLGSFKSLGGTYAGLKRRWPARPGQRVAGLVAARPAGQPTLICASDGNHGLAVAAAARFAGARAGSTSMPGCRRLGRGASPIWAARSSG
ncbi:pyridoxal-phosphate dependent enzyme [Methylobacterium oryzae CBMB20]